MTRKRPRDGQAMLGIALLVVGGLVILVKFVPWVTVRLLLKLWPLLLIYLGYRMVTRSRSEG